MFCHLLLEYFTPFQHDYNCQEHHPLQLITPDKAKKIQNYFAGSVQFIIYFVKMVFDIDTHDDNDDDEDDVNDDDH